MTNFDYAHLIQAATDLTATGGTVYRRGITPESDHFIVGGLATVSLTVALWDSLTWPTRARILSSFIDTFEDRHRGIDVWADTLGFWIDGDYIDWDLGTVHADLDSALEAARDRNEKAIFDTANQAAIPV